MKIAFWELKCQNGGGVCTASRRSSFFAGSLFFSVSQYAVRKGDWKLIKPHIDKEPQLYNLAADVGEQTDLAEQEQERYRELLTLWNEWNTQNEPERWHDPRSEGDGPGRNVKVRQNKAEITPDTTFGMKLKFDFHQGPG